MQAPTNDPGAQLMTPAFHEVAMDVFEDSAIAVATRPVLTSEYTVAVTSSGRPIVASVAAVPGSLSQPSARPAHCTVSTMAAIPNSVSRSG